MVVESLLVGLGAFITLVLASLGSTLGTYKAAASGVVASAESPENKTASIILSALPTTQSIYALVIIFMVFLPKIAAKLSLDRALTLFILGLIYGIIGFLSAYFQGKAASNGISMLSKSKDYVAYLILASLLEFFALVAFIAVILLGSQI